MLVLVAEDLDDARHAMTLLLRLKGYDVIEASNGREAVEIATRRSPDLILMDLNMPILDGIEAVRHLRAQAATAEVPIIAVTAHSGDGNWAKQARAAGCSEYLSKPLDFERLFAAIAALSPTAASSADAVVKSRAVEIEPRKPEPEPQTPAEPDPPPVEPIIPHPVPPIPGQPPEAPGEPPAPPLIAR